MQYVDVVVQGCKWNNKKALIINIMDISAKLKLRKMKEIESYKDQLLATVTHDLKTPINGMISILEVAKPLAGTFKLVQYLEVVLKNCFLLLFLIEDILDFSKI